MAYTMSAIGFFLCLSLIQGNFSILEPRHLLGLQSTSLTAGLVFNPHTLSSPRDRPVPLHIVIPCIGRESIFRMLDSLEPQLEAQDLVTVVFDGIDTHKVFGRVKKKLERMPGTTDVLMEAKSFNDTGNTLRNMHKLKGGDFVMFADDDNHYVPDALSTIRAVVHHDMDALYIFQMEAGTNLVIPDPHHEDSVEFGNVDTGCGVVPTKHAHLADWTGGPVYGADAYFYRALSERLPRTYFVRKIIYVYSGKHNGADAS